MRVPLATYRLQLTPEFGFDAARDVVPYLARLGISDLYLSPIAEARPGSTHGYDVVDPTRIRAELGGEDGFRALAEDARSRGMGILLDVVPNHMAAAWENPWWRDLLRHGRGSPHAAVFDVDWDRPAGEARGTVILPILGGPLEEALAAGEIRVEAREDGPVAAYFDRVLPLDPTTGGDAADLAALADSAAPVDPAALAALLARQHWTLVPWREAGERINYRRFFAIDDLVGVRVEDPAVFEATHTLVRRLVTEGLVTGLRIDHVDGLSDPVEYLTRVKGLTGPDGAPPYVVVEKILARREALPAEWPCEGTTGYDFLGMANGVLVDPAGLRRIEADYAEATGKAPSFREVAIERQREMAQGPFAGTMRALAEDLAPLAADDPRWPTGAGAEELRAALVEATVCLPVYRTYVRGRPVAPADAHALERAFAEARGRRADLDPAVFEVLASLLALELSEAPLPIVRRWQQTSGAVMAKGVEDTAFYSYEPLLSMNEVGSEPGAGAVSPEELADWAAARAEAWPRALNATSTHDTKRSEDARARLAALSWRPERWIEARTKWRADHASRRAVVNGEPAPSAQREIALHQAILAAWSGAPDAEEFRARIEAYLIKAMRESKTRSGWEAPDEAYERAVLAFASGLLDDPGYVAEIDTLAREVAPAAEDLALAQVLLKIAAPGIPDVYQGTEVGSLALVDPDNRRPVDYARNRRILDAVESSTGVDIPTEFDGRKMLVLARGLAARRERRDLFERGSCEAVAVEPAGERGVFALTRRWENEWAIAVVRRAPRDTGTEGGAGVVGEAAADPALRLPAGAPTRWRDALTGAVADADAGLVRLGQVLDPLPVALLLA